MRICFAVYLYIVLYMYSNFGVIVRVMLKLCVLVFVVSASHGMAWVSSWLLQELVGIRANDETTRERKMIYANKREEERREAKRKGEKKRETNIREENRRKTRREEKRRAE